MKDSFVISLVFEKNLQIKYFFHCRKNRIATCDLLFLNAIWRKERESSFISFHPFAFLVSILYKFDCTVSLNTGERFTIMAKTTTRTLLTMLSRVNEVFFTPMTTTNNNLSAFLLLVLSPTTSTTTLTVSVVVLAPMTMKTTLTKGSSTYFVSSRFVLSM